MHRGEVPSLSHYIKGTCYQCDVSLPRLISINWQRWCVSGCCPVKLRIFFREVMFPNELRYLECLYGDGRGKN